MSKTSYEQYAKDMQNLVKQLPRQLTREQEEQIGKIYLRAFKSIEKKLEKCTDNKYRERLLRAYQTQIYDELYPLIEQGIIDETEEISNIQKESMAELLQEVLENQAEIIDGKHKLQAIVNITNRRLVDQMVKGKIYYNGRGLDEMLWDATKCAEDRLNLAITSCIAQGMGAAEMSQNLKEFATGGHHTWSRNKIREKLGDGYARKYSGGLDYEALRLARTTLTHQAQLATLATSKINPYMDAVIWHSDHQAGRTCQLCLDRDGTKYYINKESVPLDHPNGMCWLEPAYSMTPEEIAKDMKAWGEGKPNSGLMDKIPEYKGLGGKAKPKVVSVAEQIAQTIADNKAELQNNYKVITENDVKEYHILRGMPELKDMPYDDQFAYNLYVRKMDSFALNRRLYTGEYGKKKGRRVHPRDEQINKFTALVAKDNLKDNSRFVRFVDEDYISGIYKQLKLSNIPDLHSDKGILDLNANLIDKVITNEAFTSVSYDQNANIFADKPIKMEIYADKGIECLYTYNYMESEVVLQRGTQFKIKGIELAEDKDKWGDPISYIKIIVKTVSKK